MSDHDTGQARRLGDRYELGETIGRGGMAEVHEGRDLRLGRRVAVKILRPDLAKDPAFQQRFRREAQSAASLNHPNIVAVYDTGEDVLDGPQAVTVPYIVMEYVDGMTLRQLLHSGRRLLPERALELTAGVLAALDYSHRHGIVHRDIKPANVMLTRAGDVKVMDFGIARALADVGQTMTQASAVMGTAQYLSPEQARGEVVDARSDLYSTGCLLYELLTGRPPFTGDSPVSVAYQHVSEQAAPPSQLDAVIPPAVDAVVMRALSKSADDRYQTAAEFRADVERAIAGTPVTAGVPVIVADQTARLAPVAGPVNPTGGGAAAAPAPRSPWVWVAVTLAAVAVAVAALLLGRALFASNAAKVTVPDLTGLTTAEAEVQLRQVGLILGQQTPVVSDKLKDRIIAQQPQRGEQLESGQAVSVTVSAGKEQVSVPNLVGLQDQAAARGALLGAGLVLGKVSEVDSDEPEGFVTAQSVPANQKVEAGSVVDISVSSGEVTVPDVVNSTQAQAIADLTNAGFVVPTPQTSPSTRPAGTVLAQSPRGGSKAKRGSTVTITVAVAPPPSSPPVSPSQSASVSPSTPATGSPAPSP
ncbi:MAG: Stk1 family PASTA domain-containing Ser/Thr kinase [Actinomycetota bacterium]|nr:MAG: Stk1 family PASTA domain-containing Ser/Thr kinase [Actinomycetota bacterium]